MNRPVAQLAERRSPKPQVGGSIPSWPARHKVDMKSTNELQAKNIISYSLMLIITLMAVYATYKYSISGAVEALVWFSWAVGIVILAYFTTVGKSILVFAQEARIEVLKIVWPTKQETVQTTTIVMVMVTLTGFALWGLDTVMMWIIARIAHLG